MQKNKKNLLIAGVIVVGLVLVVGLSLALNQGSSSLQGFLSINKLKVVKLQNNSQTLYKGACQVRLATNPNLVKYDDPDYGPGYAKVGRGQNFNSLDSVREVCAEPDYINLLIGSSQFCKQNPGALFAEEVVLYNANGTPNTSDYSVKGQGPVRACPAPDAAAAQKAAADKLAAEQAAAKNNQQQMGSPSQSQNLVVQALPQLVNVPKQPKTDGPESVASFNVLNKNQDTAVINSMTFNIQGDNSPQNVTNYELWANGTKLTTDKPDVNFSNKTVTFDNIRFVDFDQFKQVLISQNNSINVVVKAVTAKVLDGKASGVSVLYWLEVKSIALDWVSNVPKAPKVPYTAEFTPAVSGQVSTYTK